MVKFEKSSHTYTNAKGAKYISATTVVSKYKQPFDKEAIAKAYAAKHGETAEYWIAKWEEMGAQANEKGHKFHEGKEQELLSNDAIIKDTKVHEVQQLSRLEHLNNDYTILPDGVYPELILWDHDYELAGIADKVIIDGEFFDIEDYKTNKKIDRVSYHHPKTGYKMMKDPVSHMMDCNFSHYELQISIYAYMVEKLTGKKPRNLSFIHFPPDETDPTKSSHEYIVYPVQYRKREVIQMFNTVRKKPLLYNLIKKY